MKSLNKRFIDILIGFALGIIVSIFLPKVQAFTQKNIQRFFQTSTPESNLKSDTIQQTHVYASADATIDGIDMPRHLTGDCSISQTATEKRINEIWTHSSGTWISIYPLQMKDSTSTPNGLAPPIFIPNRPVKIETSQGTHYFATPESIDTFILKENHFQIQGKVFLMDEMNKSPQAYPFRINGSCEDPTAARP